MDEHEHGLKDKDIEAPKDKQEHSSNNEVLDYSRHYHDDVNHEDEGSQDSDSEDEVWKAKQYAISKRIRDRKIKDPAYKAAYNTKKLAYRNSVKHTTKFKATAADADKKRRENHRALDIPDNKFRRCNPCGKWVVAAPVFWEKLRQNDMCGKTKVSGRAFRNIPR
ncbi:hypothetical protein NA57DRAFT_75396 [Rhizodiscina lignyota]|uniref:Uncharacterized protein n=1 Tax=Rhizodiscina lignyota TaxID=1504668 RepID=A0A9P4IIF9_9PEZI|nr:hypothetical protein NA57DRAFT_75396 [Rhizodiscina lignyota]